MSTRSDEFVYAIVVYAYNWGYFDWETIQSFNFSSLHIAQTVFEKVRPKSFETHGSFSVTLIGHNGEQIDHFMTDSREFERGHVKRIFNSAIEEMLPDLNIVRNHNLEVSMASLAQLWKQSYFDRTGFSSEESRRNYEDGYRACITRLLECRFDLNQLIDFNRITEPGSKFTIIGSISDLMRT